MGRGRTARLEKESGSYFFWDTWKGSEVAKCTYAAKGLWIDVLAVMAGETPRGVITGNLEALAEALGFGAMADVWIAQNEHLVSELERKRVFSRGRDIDDSLPSDAIVNRRMYREYCKTLDVSEERRRAANARWEVQKNRVPEVVQMAAIRDEIACKTCKGDANAMQKEIAKEVEGAGVAEESGGNGGCKIMLSPTQPNPTQPTQTKERGVEGVVSLGQIVGLAMEPLTGKMVFERLLSVTRDKGDRAGWWNHVVNVFRKAGHLVVLDEHLRYIESEQGSGIKAPSRYMVKRVLASARELHIVVRELPGVGSGANGS